MGAMLTFASLTSSDDAVQFGIISKEHIMTTREHQDKVHTFAIYGDNQMYPLLGLAEEVGEVQGKVAKFIRKHNGENPLTVNDGCMLDNNEKDNLRLRDDLQLELGDVMWMVAEICNTYGLDIGEIMEKNIAKLEDRRNRGVIVGEGDHR